MRLGEVTVHVTACKVVNRNGQEPLTQRFRPVVERPISEQALKGRAITNYAK